MSSSKLFAALLVLCASAGALADPDPSAPSPQLETLVVTAHRVPTTNALLPVTVREPRQSTPVGADGLRDLPGFSISQAGNLGGLTQVRVRGAEANHLMVLMDGVEMGDPASDGGYNFANLPFANVQRVEYLPGAQSAIWGSDALAGVLYLTTEPTASARSLAVEQGSFDTSYWRAHLAERGNEVFYQLNLTDFRTDGTNVSRTGGEDDGFDQRSLQVSAGYDGAAWQLKGTLGRVRVQTEYDPTPFPDYLPQDGAYKTQHESLVAATTLTTPLPAAGDAFSNTLQLSYLDTDNHDYDPIGATDQSAGARLKASNVVRWSPDRDRRLDLLLEYERESFKQRGAISDFGDPNQSQQLETSSAAMEWAQTLWPGLQIAVSARYDSNNEFDDATSYRLAASYAPAPGWRVWANVGTGRNNPTFIERFGYTPDTFVGNAELKPEQSFHSSLGVLWHGRNLAISAVAFRDRLEDEIDGFVFDPTAGAFTAANRNDTSTRDGVETELSVYTRMVELVLGGSLLSAKEADGATEIRRPRWQAYLTATREIAQVRYDAAIYYIGGREDLDFAAYPAQRVHLSDYILARASVSYAISSRWSVALRAENLLDEGYEDQLGYRSPGRAAYLQLGLNL